MAELSTELAPKTGWTQAQSRGQYAAIAWLRWRILANGFRRKGGAGEMIARILIYPIFAAMAFAPTFGVGFGAYWFASSGHLDRIAWLLWGTFLLCQLLNIQLGQPGTTFDPTQLIRFPMGVGKYTAVRLFFGLLTPANIIGTLMSLAIAAGVTIAAPSLWLYAFVAAIVFSVVNVLFSRMVFAWVDRWLATRRAREIFTGLVFFFSLAIQWANFTYNPAYHRHGHESGNAAAKFTATAAVYHRVHPFLQALPPELTTSSLVSASQGAVGVYARQTLGCALFGVAFLAIFMLRMKTEFRGESLSDAANAVKKPAKKTAITTPRPTLNLAGAATGGGFLSPVLAGMLAKEFLYVRRNMGLFYSVVAPLVFVFLFAGRLAARGSAQYIFPAAIAYALLGITPLAYNSLGLEGAGSQFYFFAPVRLRDVMLAKNVIGFAMALFEAVAVFAIVTYVAAMPSAQTVAVGLLWAAATLLLSTTVGNRRSISAPKKINLARTANKQASPLSAFIGMGILLGSAAVAGGVLFGSAYLRLLWLPVPFLLVYAAFAGWTYWRSLASVDSFAMEHREELFLELCKKD